MFQKKKMASSRGAKFSSEIFYKTLSCGRYSEHGYSRGFYTAEIRRSADDSQCALKVFLRKFSVEVPASEQMSLIKQLRERTSAPIKDVKSSLIHCNWDIGRCF